MGYDALIDKHEQTLKLLRDIDSDVASLAASLVQTKLAGLCARRAAVKFAEVRGTDHARTRDLVLRLVLGLDRRHRTVRRLVRVQRRRERQR